jgi:hypothetical protein
LAKEHNILTSEFTEEVVFDAISQMEYNKALAHEGFPAKF